MQPVMYYISQENDKKLAMEALKDCQKGLSYDESVFTRLDKNDVSNVIFEAFKDYNVINENKKTIIDCIHDVANGEKVDEGIIAGILGGIGGVAFGPKVGQALCSALNIQKGVLYDLLTSRLVTGAICAKLGLRA